MSPIDRDHLETTGAAFGVLAAVWAFFKWLVTPLALQAAREAMREEIAALRETTTKLAALTATLDGLERRIELLEKER